MELPLGHENEGMIDNAGIRISIVGVGGAGCNTVSRIMSKGLESARTIAINTDALHLKVTNAHRKVLIGRSVTKGLGAGGYPEVALKAAETDRDHITQSLGENEIVFVCAGMGGGTGTGAAPTIARVAKEQGALTVGIVTYPFALERARLKKAQAGMQELLKYVDTLIVIDNNKLAEYMPNAQINAAFEFADSITARALKGIADSIMMPSLINMDYADLRAIMENKGVALISIGEGKGADRVNQCVNSTVNHPLLDVDLAGAKGSLIHLCGSEDLTLGESIEIGEKISQNFDPNAEVKLGARMSPEYGNGLFVTAIVTGIKSPVILGKPIDQGSSASEKIGIASKRYNEIELL